MPFRLPPDPDLRHFQTARWPGALPPKLRGAVVGIGNFDGLHRGHQSILEAVRDMAQRKGAPAAILSFDPHPRAFFSPDTPFFRLAGLDQKIRLAAHAGLNGLITVTFDAKLVATSAEDFIRDVLIGWIGVGGVVVGADFRFGAKRGGDAALLRDWGARHGFEVQAIPIVGDAGATFSSSAIRAALAAGEVETAAHMLGRLWSVEGEVLHGQKLGRTLNFPTANLKLDAGTQLAHGIYAVMVRVGHVWHKGVASYGRRPTFDNGAPLLETYIFDFSGDLYGQTIEVALAAYLRPEQKFDSVEALVAQMHEDSKAAGAALSRLTGG